MKFNIGHYVLGGLALLLVFAGVSEADYNDALDQHAQYCQMVEDKAWPDFKGIYEKECGK